MSTLPSYPQEKLDEWKAQYIELLRSTGREGIESLPELSPENEWYRYLYKTGFKASGRK